MRSEVSRALDQHLTHQPRDKRCKLAILGSVAASASGSPVRRGPHALPWITA